MKPTYGAVSRYGLVAFASSLDQIGPFATTVADAALLLEVIGGHDPADSTSLDGPAPAARSRLGEGVDGLRVGLCAQLLTGAAPDVAARVHEAAEALAVAGARVEEVSIPSSTTACRPTTCSPPPRRPPTWPATTGPLRAAG